MGKIADIAKDMHHKWEKELLSNQRSIFATVFEEMEFKEDQEGMNEEEYEQFLAALPPSYRDHLRKKASFNTLSGRDGVLDIDEFTKILDEMEVQTVRLDLSASVSRQASNAEIVNGDVNDKNNDQNEQNGQVVQVENADDDADSNDPTLNTQEHDVLDQGSIR